MKKTFKVITHPRVETSIFTSMNIVEETLKQFGFNVESTLVVHSYSETEEGVVNAIEITVEVKDDWDR